MKHWLCRFSTSSFALATTNVLAHPGHGLGTLGHDVQHQLWIFGALVVVGVVCMRGQDRNSDQE